MLDSMTYTNEGLHNDWFFQVVAVVCRNFKKLFNVGLNYVKYLIIYRYKEKCHVNNCLSRSENLKPIQHSTTCVSDAISGKYKVEV